MTRLTPLHLIPVLIAAASHAGEVTVEKRPFFIETTFSAVALPAKHAVLLKIDSQALSEFKILEIRPHGSQVTKGESLVRFDTEAITEKIDDTRRNLATATLALAQAELDLAHLQETAPHKLASLRNAAETAAEEDTYFRETKRKASEESAGQALKRGEQILANQREELKQLTQMYQDDDITEDTEEIILVRQENAVAAAEFALRMELLDHKRTLAVLLPREALRLENAKRDTAITLKKAETEIPNSIEIAKIALESQKIAKLRATTALAELEADLAQTDIKAPSSGWFYHGTIDQGSWITGDIIKSLIPNGKPPLNLPFASFIPETAPLGLVAFLDEASARSLNSGKAGIAILAGREDLEIPVKILEIAKIPGPDGKYRADLDAIWPKDLPPAAGATTQVRVISYQQDAAITIPIKALHFEDAGWAVDVKLADGKTERRQVKRGRISKDVVEILSGLEVGQVITGS
jgi:HlyD family secretion protein